MVVLAAYLAFSLPNIALPPLNPEEVHENIAVLYFLRTPSDMVRPYLKEMLPGVVVLDRYLPIMEDNPYVGALELYLQLPFFWVLGVNLFALRFMPIFVSAAGLLCCYALCRRWFGMGVALLAGVLTATHPIFVHFTRQGHYKEEIFTAALLWIGLFFRERFQRGSRLRRWNLALGMLAFGLGLGHKITFIWYLIGLVVAWAVLRGSAPASGRLGWRERGVALLFLALGSSTTILYNLAFGAPTLLRMWNSLVHPIAKDNVNNLHYPANLLLRLKQFLQVIVGGELWDTDWIDVLQGDRFPINYSFLGLFLIGYLVLSIALLRGVEFRGRRAAALLFILYTVTLLCSPFTVSWFHPSHLFVLYPFPQIVVALLVAQGGAWLARRRRAARRVVELAALVALLHGAALTVHYHQRLTAYFGRAPSPWTTLRVMSWLPEPPPPDEGLEKVPLPDRW
jgi:4-amino-4-deoxy-L-arabinose transferase-like glycosyltransferase